MPFDITVHAARKLAYFRFSGRLDTKACAQAFIDYTDHPGFDPSFLMLSDSRFLDSVDTQFSSLLSAALSLQPRMRLFRSPALSIIHARSETLYGSARMMQQVVEPLSRIRFEVLRDETAALRHARQPEARFQDLESALELQPLSSQS